MTGTMATPEAFAELRSTASVGAALSVFEAKFGNVTPWRAFKEPHYHANKINVTGWKQRNTRKRGLQ